MGRKVIIEVMQKTVLDKTPKMVKSNCSFIADMVRLGYKLPQAFTPVPSVWMAVETDAKRNNFILNGVQIHGAVTFYGGEKHQPSGLEKWQQDAIVRWFAQQGESEWSLTQPRI
ncbi:MAG: hypothetical protein WC251_03305 [Candidatus Izemoplasmatales bacterium]|jgi:hypothetical protein